jgi:hypothetical protein
MDFQQQMKVRWVRREHGRFDETCVGVGIGVTSCDGIIGSQPAVDPLFSPLVLEQEVFTPLQTACLAAACFCSLVGFAAMAGASTLHVTRI